jgi:hypothetical protein
VILVGSAKVGLCSQRVKEGLKGFKDYFHVARGNPVVL